MRKILTMLLAIALVMTLAVPLVAAPSGKSSGGRGPKVKSKVSVEGMITTKSASSFTMQILTPGHRRQVGAATATFLVQPATDLKVTVRGSGNTFTRPASINDLRVGDRAHVEAFRLVDETFLATRIHVKNRVIVGQPPQPPAGTLVSGVVIARDGNFLTVLASDGSVTVLVTSATTVRGQRSSFADIRVTDTVAVQGTVADRTITASQIEVTAAGAQVTGVIALKSPAPQFLILTDGRAVSVSEDTLIVSGGQRKSYAHLGVGQPITVAGTPIMVGPVMIGINARVITF